MTALQNALTNLRSESTAFESTTKQMIQSPHTNTVKLGNKNYCATCMLQFRQTQNAAHECPLLIIFKEVCRIALGKIKRVSSNFKNCITFSTEETRKQGSRSWTQCSRANNQPQNGLTKFWRKTIRKRRVVRSNFALAMKEKSDLMKYK